MKFFQIIVAILIGLSSTLLYQHRESISDFASLAISSLSGYYSGLFGKTTLNETAAAQRESSEAITNNANPESHFQNNLGYPEEHLVVTEMSVQRAVAKVVRAIEQAEGDGARVRRSIGTRSQRHFSPFLMLDHFASSGGFPDQ